MPCTLSGDEADRKEPASQGREHPGAEPREREEGLQVTVKSAGDQDTAEGEMREGQAGPGRVA